MSNFTRVVIFDWEYECAPGDLPNPLCCVLYVLDENLRHVQTFRYWRGEFPSTPPIDFDDDDTLCGAYSGQADLTCFLMEGWKFPKHVFDLHTAYLATSNVLLPYDPDEERNQPRKRLSDACRAYGIPGWERLDKETMAKDIGEGHWEKYGRELVLEYCEEDVRATVELLRAQVRGRPGLPPVGIQHVLHWSNYSAKAIALIQARGMPIDMQLWNLVQENKAAVVDSLLRQFDPSYGDDDPIYNPEGRWSYARFEQWLVRTGVAAWPRLPSGMLDTDSDAFRLMAHVPGVARLHALRDSLGVIVRAKLPIGRDGRNRPSLFPFGTATGRNAHGKSLYNAHAGMRSFMVIPPDTIAANLDWRAQEPGVVATLADDRALMAAYASGDIYHAFALDSGITRDRDRKHWKDHHPDQRQRMKALQLGINYGMGVPSLAKGLDRHPIIASNLIEKHRAMYPRFWQWRDEQVTNAMLTRRIESVFGWPLHLSTSPNKRTLYNFGAQANGAEMLRLAAWRLCEVGIVPSMLIHDGILIEVRDRGQIAQAIEIMRQAGRDVCNGFEIGVDIDQKLEGGARYQDKRTVAKEMWATIMGTLQNIGALRIPA